MRAGAPESALRATAQSIVTCLPPGRAASKRNAGGKDHFRMKTRLEFRFYFLDLVYLKNVSGLDILIVFQPDAAFVT